MTIVRYVIFVLSAGVVALGGLVIAGVLVPQNIPEQFRIVVGVVVVLYGVYRFVVEYARARRRSE